MKVLRASVYVIFVLSVSAYLGYGYYAKTQEDNTYPVIESSLNKIQVQCDATENELMKGLEARDEKDGDITERIMIENISSFIEKGTSTINYVVFDEDNHASTYSRTVTYTDYTSPKLILTSPLIYELDQSIDILNRVRAEDVIEGDISGSISISQHTYSSSVETKDTVDIEYGNRYGDVLSITLPITVTKQSSLGPKITLTDYITYIEKGSIFNPYSYLQGITNNEGEKISQEQLTIDSAVDTQKSGVYEVQYTCQEKESIGRTVLLVVVQE